ncbi:hypothetical protein [Massilia sp. CF038]|uniref:hypothetical protein n=1 Tax=Massilia sp. CF038 TaxID=1881045 RepID=UPI0009130511|nr:hypothetical protein [Massilia sp. CF038]SHG76648.1 hypothetical protein SAMN05428948_1946 [Massilia sp. CF038]
MNWNGLRDLLELDVGSYIKHRPSAQHLTRVFPASAEAVIADDDGDGYFQMRLCEMRLTDDRRWMTEVAPAALFVATYLYNGAPVRHPIMVSNAKVAELAEAGITGVLRIKFKNQLIVGPTPYAGGDVSLLVSLCQIPLKDWRKSVFAIVEKIFDGVDVGGLGSYLRMADKLTGEAMKVLGGAEPKCLLAEQNVVGQQARPSPGHIAFIAADAGTLNDAALVIEDDQLFEVVDGARRAFNAADYCLIKIEHQATRGDYTSMPFHKTWQEARAKMIARHLDEADRLMVTCAQQLFASPDLTDGNKMQLTQLYKAKLEAVRELMKMPAREPLAAVRAGQAVSLATGKGGSAEDKISDAILAEIVQLSIKLKKEGDADFDDARIGAYLTQARTPAARKPQHLMRVIMRDAVEHGG